MTMKLDHFVINVDEKYQKDSAVIRDIRALLPYEPNWGKGTSGFKVSDLWIGNEYLEMVRISKKDGGGWIPEWTAMYRQGHRGLVCLMLDVSDLDPLHRDFVSKGLPVSQPEWLEFKWFFGLFNRRMPWRNCYLPFFENVPFQIGFQEMKDDKSRSFMNQYMVPNAREHGIGGICRAVIKGGFSERDFDTIVSVFGLSAHKDPDAILIRLNENQTVEFVRDTRYEVELYTDKDSGRTVRIENSIIHC